MLPKQVDFREKCDCIRPTASNADVLHSLNGRQSERASSFAQARANLTSVLGRAGDQVIPNLPIFLVLNRNRCYILGDEKLDQRRPGARDAGWRGEQFCGGAYNPRRR